MRFSILLDLIILKVLEVKMESCIIHHKNQIKMMQIN